MGGEGAQPGQAGQGGQAEPACRRDRDCRDVLACNGLESCVEGECVPGDAVTCSYGTHCTEAGAERCVYDVLSPWLVATTVDKLLGLPIAEIGRERALATVAERPRSESEVLQGFESVHWTRDGRAALVRSLEREIGYRLELLRFGAGAVAQVTPVSNIPTWGEYSEDPDFSVDSRRALVVDRYSGLYAVDLDERPEPTLQIAAVGSLGTSWFCADPNSWIVGDYSSSAQNVTTLKEGEVAVRQLGLGSVTPSPDRRLFSMTLSDDDGWETGASRIGACSEEDWSVDFADAKWASFSDDSQLLLLEHEEQGVRVMSLAEPQSPLELWSNELARVASGTTFVAEHLLLLEYAAGDAEPSLHLVDPTAGPDTKPQPLGLPPGADIAALTSDALLAWVDHVGDDGRDLYWQKLEPDEEPSLVLSEGSSGEVTVELIAGLAGSRLLVRPEMGNKASLSLLHFDAQGFELLPVATLTGKYFSNAGAPDRSGLAVLMRSEGVIFDNVLHWIPLVDGEPGRPLEIARGVLTVTVQPWP